MSEGIHAELAELSQRYAAALDRRDLSALLSVFHPQATLRAHPVGRNPMVLETHGQLKKLIAAVEYWPRTYHFVGQGLFEVRDGQARGEVYCVANHFSSAQPGQGDNYVMYIRYLDTYAKDDGRWVIVERDVVTDAAERRDLTL